MKPRPPFAALFSLRLPLELKPLIAATACAVLLTSAGSATAQQAAGAPEVHVVRAGETLPVIARKYGVSTRDLAAWNGITNPSLIKVGQRLRISAPVPAAMAEQATPRAAPAKPDIRTSEEPIAKPAATTTEPASPAAVDAAVAATASQAEELRRLRSTTSSLISLLLQQGVITRDKAELLIQEANLGPLPAEVVAAAPIPEAAEGLSAETQAPTRKSRRSSAPAEPAGEQTAVAEPGVVRVPYVPQVVKDEIRDQVREEVIAQAKSERWAEPSTLPEWLDRITWEGDIRLRYEEDRYQSSNTPVLVYNALTGANLNDTQNNQELWNYRLRLGMLARISDQWGVGVRLSSGNTNNPVSANQTMGNYFNKASLTLDQAYVRWDPNANWDLLGGRTPNPFFSTNLIWDEDLSFDGFSATYKATLWPGLQPFVTAGYYLVQWQGSTPQTPDPKTKTMIGVQAGSGWELSSQTKLKVGLAYYAYQNIWGIPNQTLDSQEYNWTAPQFRQKGNTVFNIDADSDPSTTLYALASKFDIVNLTASADLAQFEPYLLRVTGDFAKNVGFNQSEIARRTGLQVDPHTTAYKMGFTFGKDGMREFGDWQTFFNYRYIGADAVLDAFNDSDFHLGGTDAKGYEIGGRVALHRNVWTQLRWLSADEISGPPLSIDVLQLDLNARF